MVGIQTSKKEEKVKLRINEKEGSIEINDSLETKYYILIFINVLNIINAVLNWFYPIKKNFHFFQVIWVLLGIISCIILIYLFTKKSSSSKIPIELVQNLKERTFLGKKKFSLQLTNGKQRELPNVKNKSEILALRNVLSEIGIQ